MKGLKHKLSGKNKENLQKSQKQTDLFDKSH